MSTSNDLPHGGKVNGDGDGDRGCAQRAPDDANGAAPRAVTTGGKIRGTADHALKVPDSLDDETGEHVLMLAVGQQRVEATRQLSTRPNASPKLALVDALAVSLVPPTQFMPELWLVNQLRPYLPINHLQQRKGYSGFTFSAAWDNGMGLIAWGGKSQRGRMYVSIQGQGCATVHDWPGLAQWLEQHKATIKRVDLAHDDFAGEITDISWAIEQYKAGGFNAGGRQPVHQVFGDWLSGEQSTEGRTFGIGRRSNGKFCRIYEKGKQQGDPTSGWVRVEVEWRAERRHIPYDVLTRPGIYLAGAYPCMAMLSTEQERIRTTANSTSITFESAVENAKQQNGRLINLMLHVYGGDYVEVVERLRREGLPARLESISHAFRDAPELLDSSNPDGFIATSKADKQPGSSSQ